MPAASVKRFCIFYPLAGIAYLLLTNLGIVFTNVTVYNLAFLVLFPSILFWFSWIYFLKPGKLRVIGTLINAIWIISVSFPVVWLTWWTMNDLRIGNGPKLISERTINGETVKIYRAPDEGTFGGRKPYACRASSIFPGVEYQRRLGKEWLPAELQREL